LLDSVRLDVPSTDSKIRTKAAALTVLREQQLDRTTQFTAFALGGTVSRLLSAVTLVDRPVSALRLAFRGIALGVAFGAATLTFVVSQRYLQTPHDTDRSTATTLHAPDAALAPHEPQHIPTTSLDSALSLVELDLTEHRPNLALQRLDDLANARFTENAKDRFTLLRIRATLALGRRNEAKQLVEQALATESRPIQRQALEALRAEM
jgi:hypothetical protein